MIATKAALGFFIVLSFVTNASARKVPNWNFNSLLAASDIVAIVTLDTDTTVNESLSEFEHFAVVCHVSKFRVESSLKGDAGASITVKYYEYKKNDFLIGTVNGPVLASFGRDTRYLIYVKKDANGDLIPTSGQSDSALAVFELRPTRSE